MTWKMNENGMSDLKMQTLNILGKCHVCGQKTGFKQNDHAGQSPSPLLVVFSCFFWSLGVASPFWTR